MKIFKNTSILAVILSTCVQYSGAQETSQSPVKASKQARFLFLGKVAGTPEVIKVQERGGPKDLVISTRSPGKYHALPATGAITIGTLQMVEDQEVLVPLAKGLVPKGASKVLALVFPVDAKKYRMIVMNENTFKPGSIFFINTTAKNVGALIDDKPYRIKAKQHTVVHPKVGAKSRNTYAAFYDIGSAAKPTPRKMITESTWNISIERAEVCIFYMHPVRKKIGMRVLSSFYGLDTGEQTKQQ